jgi:hypothetical protein
MVKLTRREMYDLVWSKPMTKVASNFNISDVALKKICDKHRVPTPPRGYWAKKNAGQKVKQVRLHATAYAHDELITIYGSTDNLPAEIKAVLVEERERSKANAAEAKASVAPIEPVADVHEVVRPTANALRKSSSKDGGADANGPGRFGIRIGVESVERAISILDTLARRVEERGLTIEAGENCIVIKTVTDSLQMTMTERVDQQKHQPTMAELAHAERIRKKRERDAQLGRWNYDNERAYLEFDFIRTGELALGIKNEYVDGSPQRNWRDGKRRTLHEQIEEITSGIVTYLAAVKVRREKQEQWQEEYRLREERQRRDQARANRHEKRMDFLKRIRAAQMEATDLKMVLDTFQNMPEGKGDAISRMQTWIITRIGDLNRDLTRENLNAIMSEELLFSEIDTLSEEE